MGLEERFKEALMYLKATGKTETTFKLTPKEIEEVKKLKSVPLKEFRWFWRLRNEDFIKLTNWKEQENV